MSWVCNVLSFVAAVPTWPRPATQKDKLGTAIAPHVKDMEAVARVQLKESVHDVTAVASQIIERIAGSMQNGRSIGY